MTAICITMHACVARQWGPKLMESKIVLKAGSWVIMLGEASKDVYGSGFYAVYHHHHGILWVNKYAYPVFETMIFITPPWHTSADDGILDIIPAAGSDDI